MGVRQKQTGWDVDVDVLLCHSHVRAVCGSSAALCLAQRVLESVRGGQSSMMFLLLLLGGRTLQRLCPNSYKVAK